MSPPGLTAIPASGGTTCAVTPESLIRDAARLMAACGVARGANWTSRIVRTYLGSAVHGLPFGDYLAVRLELNAQQRADMLARSEFARVISYRDPTGETAVAHVMRERRS